LVEFRIKVNPEQRLAYIPKEIFEVLGSDLKAVGNRTAVIFYPESATIKDVLISLKIIRADLRHALQLEEKETKSQ